MAGLYIHIPFCNSKCGYCGFYSLPSLKMKERFLEALKQEIVLRKAYLNETPINTIYFGGGTPSLLSVNEIGDILHLINTHYLVADNAESGGNFAGCNFWGWGGYANPRHEQWKIGDDYCGDPAQEAQGLNSVFISDKSTLKVVRQQVKRMRKLKK